MKIPTRHGAIEPLSVEVRRGIIHLHLSAIHKLAAELPANFAVDPLLNLTKPLRLWDLIPFLKRNGFKICVLEAVSYEAAGLMRDGSTINSRFENNLDPFRARLQKLLQESFNAGDLEILPAHDKDTTRAAQFMRSLYRAQCRKTTPIEKRIEIQAINRDYDKSFGTICAEEYLRLERNHDGLQVFYLSDDTSSLYNVDSTATNANVHILSTVNFLGALLDQGIFSELNISIERLPALTSAVVKYFKDMGRESYFVTLPSYTNSENQRVFGQTLLGICDASQKPPSSPSQVQGAPVRRSGMDRFARYGAFAVPGRKF